MGLRGISIGSIAIVLVVVLLIFGVKRLRGIGGDLGAALKNFKKNMQDDEPKDNDEK